MRENKKFLLELKERRLKRRLSKIWIYRIGCDLFIISNISMQTDCSLKSRMIVARDIDRL